MWNFHGSCFLTLEFPWGVTQFWWISRAESLFSQEFLKVKSQISNFQVGGGGGQKSISSTPPCLVFLEQPISKVVQLIWVLRSLTFQIVGLLENVFSNSVSQKCYIEIEGKKLIILYLNIFSVLKKLINGNLATRLWNVLLSHWFPEFFQGFPS